MNEIEEAAEKAKNNSLVPEKSKNLYQKTYDDYQKWCDLRKNSIENYFSEKTLLAYFWHLSKARKPSSLWSYYSMLKATIKANHNVDISGYSSLFGYLKRTSEGFKPKKSKILTLEEVEDFIYQAPEEIYLMNKVVLIFGIAGACRKQELVQLEVDDIQDIKTSLLITLRDTKTKRNRMFSVVDGHKSPSFLEIYRKYAALRPTNMESRRFFLAYRNGKCTRQVVGKNVLGEIPKKIASYLNLPNPELYTGHTFRRSSATLLANAGEGIIGIKQLGGWKSTSVAEQYIEDSVSNKIRLAEKVLTKKDNNLSASTSVCESEAANPSNKCVVTTSNKNLMCNYSQLVPPPNINMNNCNNCIVNIHYPK